MIFTRTVLPGGIRVVTERMPEVRSVSIGFWVGIGSRDESQEFQGSSHFLEHVLFKGTETRTARDISDSFDAVGGEVNAFSAKEYTCFYGRILDKDLPMASEIIIDMLCNASLRHDDVESERKVILEEISMRDDTPEDLVHELFIETLFGSHPLAREVMGTAESVGSITPETLRDFHGEHYHPANIVVAAAGNLEHDQLVSWIEASFPDQQRHASPREQNLPLAPKSRVKVMTRDTEQAHIIVGGLGYSRHHPDRFAWGVLDDLLGGGSSSRLFQEIREQRGLAYSVYSYRHMFVETGMYAAYAGTAPANAMNVLKLIEEELQRLLDAGITDEEMERAKGRSRGSLVLSLEDPASRMSRLGRSDLVHGEILSIDDLLARLDAVTADDVARVARELLKPEDRVLTVIGPFQTEDFDWWAARE